MQLTQQRGSMSRVELYGECMVVQLDEPEEEVHVI